jgi:hypothetical protein
MFTYTFECPHCGVQHVEHRVRSYERKIRKKICPECKASRHPKVDGPKVTISGDDEKPECCMKCKHFGAPTDEDTSKWFKACAKGWVSAEALEENSKLVYIHDYCEEFENET